MALRARLQADKALGCEYATFQMHLPPSYMNTGGAYRQVGHGCRPCGEPLLQL